MPLHQFDYLLAVGTIFAFLDAWNIGANDVANSWATSVGSRSVTYLQAMGLASIMEFSGSIGVGARVSETIRTKIVNLEHFEQDASLLLLGMVCAVIASSLYLTAATRIGFPVSTTHSLIGGILGMGIATVGTQGIHWVGDGKGSGIINGGVVQVFMAWIIAPGLSGIFASIIFLITKYGVLLRQNPVRKAFFLVPVYFGITAGLLAMLLIWKGASSRIDLTDAGVAGAIVGVAVGWAALVAIFLMPWLHRVVIVGDWQLRWWHIPLGPLLLRRGEVPPPPDGTDTAIKDFYEGHLTREELEARRAAEGGAPHDVESAGEGKGESQAGHKTSIENKVSATPDAGRKDEKYPAQEKSLIGPKPEGKWYNGDVLFWYFKFALFRGVDKDIVHLQKQRSDMLTGDLDELHAHAAHYNNQTEYMYSFLQVMTAATASFTHGANDVSNAVGPYATIFQIWNEGALPAEGKSDVPTWILAFGGVALVIGLWTYGYRIMSHLGNRITLHSPSRGFSMELGSAITIIIATRLKLPVSTTQCITGATVGVGLCAGTWRTINWRMVSWIYVGWIITLPIAGIISGCLMGFIINAPRWGYSG